MTKAGDRLIAAARQARDTEAELSALRAENARLAEKVQALTGVTHRLHYMRGSLKRIQNEGDAHSNAIATAALAYDAQIITPRDDAGDMGET